MTDVDRNTRTLIVSFAIAIMALIPLRFIEVGQMLPMAGNEVQVLGVDTMGDEVILPNAQVEVPQEKEGVLEAPYDRIDGDKVLGVSTETVTSQETVKAPAATDCIASADADGVVASLRSELAKDSLGAKVRIELLNQIRMVEVNRCK